MKYLITEKKPTAATFCSVKLGSFLFANDLFLFGQGSQHIYIYKKNPKPLTNSEHKVKPFPVKTAHISCWLLHSSSNVATVKPGLCDMITMVRKRREKFNARTRHEKLSQTNILYKHNSTKPKQKYKTSRNKPGAETHTQASRSSTPGLA